MCLPTPFPPQASLPPLPNPPNPAPGLPAYIDIIAWELTALERRARTIESPPFPNDGASLDAQLEIIYEGMGRIRRGIDDVKNSNGHVEKLEDGHFYIHLGYLVWQNYLSRVLRYPASEGYAGMLLRWLGAVRMRVFG
jgi:hypothetical protein